MGTKAVAQTTYVQHRQVAGLVGLLTCFSWYNIVAASETAVLCCSARNVRLVCEKASVPTCTSTKIELNPAAAVSICLICVISLVWML